MEQRVISVIHGADFKNMIPSFFYIVAQELTERTFVPSHVRQNPPLDHELRTQRDLEIDSFGGIAINRGTVYRGSYSNFTVVLWNRCASTKKNGWIGADEYSCFQCLILFLDNRLIGCKIMARTQSHSQLVVVDVHRAMKREVMGAG